MLLMMVNVSAMQEQMMQTLDSIEKRLSNLELKISRIEKCVSFENADFDPSRKTA